MISKFIFVSGVLFDVIITTIGVLLFDGTEGNIFLKWIYPKSLLITIFILSNIFLLIFVYCIIKKRNTKFLNYFIAIMGLYRFSCAATWF